MAPEADGTTESDKALELPEIKASDDDTVHMGVNLRELPATISISGRQLLIIFVGLALLIRYGPSVFEYWTTQDVVCGFPGRVRPRPTFEGPAGQIKWGPCGDSEVDFYPLEVQCGHAMFVVWFGPCC